MLQINELRNDTPGCKNVLHFNNAGASLSPQPVIQVVKKHLDKEAMMGGYEAAAAVQNATEKFYSSAAQLINCNPSEIAFVDNATHAWDMAFYSLQFKKGDRILTAKSEYASNYLAFLHRSKHQGIEIDVIEDDEFGQLDLDDLSRKVKEKVRLIAITHIPTQGGLVNPAEEVGKIAKQHGIPYLLDATQSIGQMPVDVKQIGCDFLCATGRKYLRGPRGTGFLFVSHQRIAECNPPFIDLHSAKWISNDTYQLDPTAKRFETWEQNISTKLGLAAAIDYAIKLGLPDIWDRIQALSTIIRNKLSDISGIKLQDLGKNKCGIVTFTCEMYSPEVIQNKLALNKINVSVSLQEYARLDLVSRNISALVRASVHYYNTEEEIEKFCSELKALIT